ncbi:hypothetical protein IAD21_04420 [Abditibacteriota bacterium]|nr:hypothetical protein IAD21_04420 [Abditibacteriota bacterium]
MPPLSLAPWEISDTLGYNSQGLAHTTHSIPWMGGHRDFLFRAVEVAFQSWVIFARPVDSEDEGNWVVCGEEGNLWIAVHVVLGGPFYEIPEFDALSHIAGAVDNLSCNDSQFQLGRLVIISIDGKEKCAVLTQMGWGRWVGLPTLELNASFHLPPSRDFLDDSGLVYEWVSRQIDQPDSDVSFSCSWSGLNEREQIAVLCGSQEQIAQIQATMRWTLQLQRGLWTDNVTYKWLLGGGPDNGVLLREPPYLPSGSRRTEELETRFPLIFEMGRFLLEHHVQRLIAPLRQRYRCTHDYPFHDEGQSCCWAWIELESPPTAHERFEATLSLQQWLRAHASPEEFAAIVQHLDE